MRSFFSCTFIIPKILSKYLLHASSVLCTGEPRMKSYHPSLPGAKHQEVPEYVEHLLWELLRASEHIFLIGRCYTPIKSAIRGSMNDLMAHRAACPVQHMRPEEILLRR